MSGQWEVVGKNKKNAQNGKQKSSKDEKLTSEPSKLGSANNDQMKDSKSKPPKENKTTDSKKSNPKKQHEKKSQESPKPKPAKTIEGALKQESSLTDSTTKTSSMFLELFNRLPSSASKSSNVSSSEVTISLLECFRKDSNILILWKENYGKHIKQSVYLLNYIKLNWNENKKIFKSNVLRATLKDFQRHNNELLSKSKKKDDILVESNRLCQDILDKMSRSRGFPWFYASLFVLSAIIGVVIYDVNQKGSFEKSATGKYLKDVGAYEILHESWVKSLGTSARAYIWVETNTPYYYHRAVEFGKPYAHLTYDLALVSSKTAKQMYNNVQGYAAEKTPVVAATIEQYAPGLIENVQGYTSKAWIATRDFSIHYYNISVHYLGTKVFIDEWAPEVLKAKSLHALNATRIYAAQYYDWFHKQVDIYSKVK